MPHPHEAKSAAQLPGGAAPEAKHASAAESSAVIEGASKRKSAEEDGEQATKRRKTKTVLEDDDEVEEKKESKEEKKKTGKLSPALYQATHFDPAEIHALTDELRLANYFSILGHDITLQSFGPLFFLPKVDDIEAIRDAASFVTESFRRVLFDPKVPLATQKTYLRVMCTYMNPLLALKVRLPDLVQAAYAHDQSDSLAWLQDTASLQSFTMVALNAATKVQPEAKEAGKLVAKWMKSQSVSDRALAMEALDAVVPVLVSCAVLLSFSQTLRDVIAEQELEAIPKTSPKRKAYLDAVRNVRRMNIFEKEMAWLPLLNTYLLTRVPELVDDHATLSGIRERAVRALDLDCVPDEGKDFKAIEVLIAHKHAINHSPDHKTALLYMVARTRKLAEYNNKAELANAPKGTEATD